MTGNALPPSGKWLAGVDPDDPLTKAAGMAVAWRLASVAAYLPLAAYSPEEDLEYVHQLRVTSRRAAAAIAAFGECLPPRRARKIARKLQRIRRAAGDARDVDVLLLRLESSPTALDPDELRDVLEFLHARRQEAQPAIVRMAKKLPRKRLEKRIAAVVKRIRWRRRDAEPTIYSAAEKRMSLVTEEFRQAADALAGDASIEALHRLRIAGKRLRYTIELFACVADKSLRRDVYPLIEALQDRLGALNDHATAEAYFRTFAAAAQTESLHDDFQRLAHYELLAVEHSAEAFRRWWNATRLSEIYNGAHNAFPPPFAAKAIAP